MSREWGADQQPERTPGKCDKCNGTGQLHYRRCYYCRGSGESTSYETYEPVDMDGFYKVLIALIILAAIFFVLLKIGGVF